MEANLFEVNEQVIGKSKSFLNQLGIVKDIIFIGKKRKYSILFSNNKTETVSCRSIKKITTFTSLVNHNDGPDEPIIEEANPDIFDEDNMSLSTSSSASDNEINGPFLK
jgi:hypothetical protein